MLIQDRISIAAGVVNRNLLEGSQFEFLPFDAEVRFGINGDVAGQEVIVDVYSGGDVLAESMPLNAQNRAPTADADFILRDVAAAGERLKIRARNTGASAHIVFFAVSIEPIG